MKRLDGALTALSIPHRIAVFDGGHRWPEAALCADALERLHVQGARHGLIAKNSPIVDERLARERRQEESMRAAGRVLEADRLLAEIVRDFDGLRDVSAPLASLAREQRSPEHKRLVKEDAGRDDRERRLLSRHEALLQAALGARDAPFARLVRDLAIGELQAAARARRDPAERKVAVRVLQSLFVRTSFDLAQELREKREPTRAALSLSVATEIRPEDARVWYNLACAQAVAGQRVRALSSLTRAVELGLPPFARIERDPDFSSLRDDREFLGLVGRAAAAPGGTVVP